MVTVAAAASAVVQPEVELAVALSAVEVALSAPAVALSAPAAVLAAVAVAPSAPAAALFVVAEPAVKLLAAEPAGPDTAEPAFALAVALAPLVV